MEPGKLGGVPWQLLVVGRHNGGHVVLRARVGAILVLLRDLVLDVDDGGVRWKVRMRVVPPNAPA